jgi:hypothetical protein
LEPGWSIQKIESKQTSSFGDYLMFYFLFFLKKFIAKGALRRSGYFPTLKATFEV